MNEWWMKGAVKDTRKGWGSSEHNLLELLPSGPAFVLMTHPICLLETFKFWRIPRIVYSFQRSPHNFNFPTWVSCRFQPNFRVAKNHILFLLASPLFSPLLKPTNQFQHIFPFKQRVKDCKAYNTYNTTFIFVKCQWLKNRFVSPEIRVVLQRRGKVLGSEYITKL